MKIDKCNLFLFTSEKFICLSKEILLALVSNKLDIFNGRFVIGNFKLQESNFSTFLHIIMNRKKSLIFLSHIYLFSNYNSLQW